MADALDSKSSTRKGVWVQVPPPAPMRIIMSLNIDASRSGEDLAAELAERGKFYAKGFGSVLGLDVLPCIEILEDNFEDNWMYQIVARQGLDIMSRFYDRISFGEMIDHPDAELLFEIKDVIQLLRSEFEFVFLGDFSHSEAVYEHISTIHDLGQIYRARLHAIQEALRVKEGFEYAGLRVVDLHGKIWNSALG